MGSQRGPSRSVKDVQEQVVSILHEDVVKEIGAIPKEPSVDGHTLPIGVVLA